MNRTGKCGGLNVGGTLFLDTIDADPGARFPPSALAIADINADGVVNAADVPLLVADLLRA